ncbi:M15 family metallopeptidase [Nocardioides sp. LML1-1-1.1]|uniref:M15 family metallopeptidase n=1 Tax=Nocardioides sp. LML1-1-1.1 TaxID=3135248 RepID=UPI00341FF768
MALARRARLTAGLTAGASALLVAALLSGCGTSSKDAGEKDDPTKAAASTSAVPTNALDPAHAVSAPGRFDGTQYGDDLLLVSDETLPADVLKQIVGITVGTGKAQKKGIAAYDLLSYGNFSVENKLYNIAAVDAAKYRAFTGSRSAEFQEQWDRVAGGEIAIMDRLQKEIPVDGEGYVEVGKQRLHVGAWSPAEVDAIDAMVNEKWGETLGLPEDNAILINTGIASPQAVREVIEKRFGVKRFSITALDIVASEGLDLKAYQNVIPVGAFGDAVGVFRYRPIGGGRIAPDPGWVKAHIVTEQVPILGTVTCNRYMMPQLKAALAEVQASKLADKIHPDEYAGCYYPRFIAGSNKLSNHSFGLALDFNVPGNQRGTVGQMDRGVVAIFKRWGFAWGGDWAYTDPMHFELAKIVNPG